MQMDCHINGYHGYLGSKLQNEGAPKHQAPFKWTWNPVATLAGNNPHPSSSASFKKKTSDETSPPFIPLLIQTVQKIEVRQHIYIYIHNISKYYAWEHTSWKMFHKQSKVPGINKDSARARGLRETWVFLERWTHAKTQPKQQNIGWRYVIAYKCNTTNCGIIIKMLHYYKKYINLWIF